MPTPSANPIWNELAEIDPLWAVLSEPDKRHGRWSVEAFFATGEQEVTAALDTCVRLVGAPNAGTALDFGCGVGRLSRALAVRFERVVAVDASPDMIKVAARMNPDVENVDYVVNGPGSLQPVASGSVDFVYSNRVFQHLSSEREAVQFLREFSRVLAPDGLLCVGIPDHRPLANRIAIRRRLFQLLRLARVPAATIYKRLGIYPAPMRHVAREAVVDALAQAGTAVVGIERDTEGTPLYVAVRRGDG